MKVLAFNFGTMTALGGVMALPGFAVLSMLTGALFGDGDEPDNAEATLRRMIGDKETADLILKGAPKLAGIDLSQRLGAGGMLSLLPFAEPELSRDGYKDVIFNALGPAVSGFGGRMVEGAGLMAGGQFWKGSEMLLPGLLGNTLKGIRMSTEGVSQRNGDIVLSPDEIGFMQGLSVAFGTPSNTITDRNFLTSAKFKADKFYNDRTSSLKREYGDAYRDGDSATMRSLRDEWMQTQEARKRLGYKPQPLSDLLKAPQEQRKREATAMGGVQTTKANAGFIGALQ